MADVGVVAIAQDANRVGTAASSAAALKAGAALGFRAIAGDWHAERIFNWFATSVRATLLVWVVPFRYGVAAGVVPGRPDADLALAPSAQLALAALVNDFGAELVDVVRRRNALRRAATAPPFEELVGVFLLVGGCR